MAKVWIDLENAPHAVLYNPIIDVLESQGHEWTVTLRDFGMTRELMRKFGRPFTKMGGEYGRSLPAKAMGLLRRTLSLVLWARGRGFDVAASHGSRSQVLAASILGIPSLSMYDYEYVATGIFDRFSSKVMIPEALPDAILSPAALSAGRYVRYPGQKESIYLGNLRPDPSILEELNVGPDQILVIMRPPASSAHYHADGGDAIFLACLEHVLGYPNAVAVVVPRSPGEGEKYAESLRNPLNLRILRHPVDGLNLIWMADMVCGGGGTMNREAASMNVPVYSVFLGKVGAVDGDLAKAGKMGMIRSVEDVTQIKVQKRDRPDIGSKNYEWMDRSEAMCKLIVGEIISLVDS
jgi:predicted glycosyltransferase